MKEKGKRVLGTGMIYMVAFILWTILIQKVDVRVIGAEGTKVGFAGLNAWFHELTGVNMVFYTITDWLGLIPLFVCLIFAAVGLIQWIRRKSIVRVDFDIRFLGFYYLTVIITYFIFEMIPVNYRPILIDGFLEASYPSSTTLLVLCVMPTLIFQANRRVKNMAIKRIIGIWAMTFSALMVIGRLLSGVHWITDIVGAVLFSAGLFGLYRGLVLLKEK